MKPARAEALEHVEQEAVGDRVARIDRVRRLHQRGAGAFATRDRREHLALGARQAARRIGELLEVTLERAGEERQSP